MTRAELDDRAKALFSSLLGSTGPLPAAVPESRIKREIRSALADAVAVAYLHAARKAEQLGRPEEDPAAARGCRVAAGALYDLADGMAEFIVKGPK